MSSDVREKTQVMSNWEIEEDLKYHGFEIVRLISDKGGMADVYEAWQPSVKRKIAAKRLKSHLVTNPDVRARFEEEALLLGSLNHPHIVQVIDFSSEKLTLFMEFVEGKPLDEALAERERLPLEEALRITSEVLDGLSYAHSKNIIHRDVKPGNIFLNSDGMVKLGDFGIAAIIGPESRQEEAQAESWLGTPYYVAPEQLTGSEIDGRVDVYAVGVTLYLLLTGRLPFVAESSSKTAALRLSQDPEPPSALNPMISPDLNSLVLKALARSPEDRFLTAAEFKAAVDALLSPRREIAYIFEAKAELEKASRASTTGKKRLLVSCIKLSQMALAENPEHLEAKELLSGANAELSVVRRKEYFLFGGLLTVIVLIIAVLAVLLSRGHGSLELVTNEPAAVYLDGEKIGESPFVFTNLPAGSHRLFIEQPGFYRSIEREILIEKGKIYTMTEPIPDGGTIVVSSAIPGSIVKLNGVEIGKTPLTRKIVVGKHLLDVAGDVKEIMVIENETSSFSFSRK